LLALLSRQQGVASSACAFFADHLMTFLGASLSLKKFLYGLKANIQQAGTKVREREGEKKKG
jgi:hypothetical protein